MNDQRTETAKVCVQCLESATGVVGTFLGTDQADGRRVALSPVFPSLAELFPWMNRNGWNLAEHVGAEFIPWRAARGETAADGLGQPPPHGYDSWEEYGYATQPEPYYPARRVDW